MLARETPNLFWIVSGNNHHFLPRRGDCFQISFASRPFVPVSNIGDRKYHQLPSLAQYQEVPIEEIIAEMKPCIENLLKWLLGDVGHNEQAFKNDDPFLRLQYLCIAPSSLNTEKGFTLIEAVICNEPDGSDGNRHHKSTVLHVEDSRIECAILPNGYGILKFS